ncbi:MAG: DUF2760 domain-containing protein [Caldilineaceae bacterium]
MEEKRTFTIQTFIATVVLNAILLAVIFFVGGEAVQNQLLLILGAGLLITLLLWFIIQTLGNRLLEQVAQRTLAATPKIAPTKASPKPEPAPVAPQPTIDTGKLLAQGAKSGAVQMLAILQRQGRLVDFLQEDLSGFADDQIGAAVRSIHEGCKQALDQHVKLEPIYSESEGSRVTVQPGFDPEFVRLSGNVVGEPPFTGELQHRGWRVATIDLPKRLKEDETQPVVAAAEVEV